VAFFQGDRTFCGIGRRAISPGKLGQGATAFPGGGLLVADARSAILFLFARLLIAIDQVIVSSN
jgi:hypothetical protein